MTGRPLLLNATTQTSEVVAQMAARLSADVRAVCQQARAEQVNAVLHTPHRPVRLAFPGAADDEVAQLRRRCRQLWDASDEAGFRSYAESERARQAILDRLQSGPRQDRDLLQALLAAAALASVTDFVDLLEEGAKWQMDPGGPADHGWQLFTPDTDDAMEVIDRAIGWVGTTTLSQFGIQISRCEAVGTDTTRPSPSGHLNGSGPGSTVSVGEPRFEPGAPKLVRRVGVADLDGLLAQRRAAGIDQLLADLPASEVIAWTREPARWLEVAYPDVVDARDETLDARARELVPALYDQPLQVSAAEFVAAFRAQVREMSPSDRTLLADLLFATLEVYTASLLTILDEGPCWQLDPDTSGGVAWRLFAPGDADQQFSLDWLDATYAWAGPHGFRALGLSVIGCYQRPEPDGKVNEVNDGR